MPAVERRKRPSDDWCVRLGVPGSVIFGGNLFIWLVTGDSRYHDRTLFFWLYGLATLSNLALLGWWLLRRAARA